MSDPTPIRILSVDDHPLLRAGLTAVIQGQQDMCIVAQAATGREAVEKFREHRPDVMLLDLRLPDMNGVDVLIAIRKEFPAAHVIVYTTFEGDVEIQRALKAGARGYVLKRMPPRNLLEVIRHVHGGKTSVPPEVSAHLIEHMGEDSLTPREIDVLRHVAGGNRNRDIAERLCISEDTVKSHLKRIMEKLGASDRAQAIAIALQRGVMHL
jgi:DNA-binding NarL/FixJ family response regulator